MLNSETVEAIMFVKDNFQNSEIFMELSELDCPTKRGQAGNNGGSDLMFFNSRPDLHEQFTAQNDVLSAGMRNVKLDTLVLVSTQPTSTLPAQEAGNESKALVARGVRAGLLEADIRHSKPVIPRIKGGYEREKTDGIDFGGSDVLRPVIGVRRAANHKHTGAVRDARAVRDA
jgi:hypothetical protein